MFKVNRWRSRLPFGKNRAAARTPAAAPNERTQRLWDTVVNVGFVGLLSLPVLGIFLGLGESFDHVLEGRDPAPPPRLINEATGRPNGVGTLSWQLDDYLRDNLSFRREAMHAFLWSQSRGLTTVALELPIGNRDPSTKVLQGRDGWLFYTGDRSITGYRRTDPFRPDQLERLRQEYERKQRALAERGIDYVLSFAPDKGTVYPECLPFCIRAAKAPSRMDQLIDCLRTHTAVRILDFRPDLREAKKQRDVYFKTDSHWNDFGALVACRALLRELRHPDAETETADHYDFIERYQDGYERRMLGQIPPQERIEVTLPRRPRQAQLDRDPEQWWPSRALVARNPAAPGRSCAVLHDSFFHWVAPFFNEHFQEVRYFIRRDLPLDEMGGWRPDVVIECLVERKLNLVD